MKSTESVACLIHVWTAAEDRLLHVVLATSDSFFMQHLRQMNILQHCYLMTIGDPSYEEAKEFYRQQLIPIIPDHLASKIDFEDLYDYFGGKLTHLSDFVADWGRFICCPIHPAALKLGH